MKILFTQEADWINRNPHQPHHLAEILSRLGHEIRVIDYELMWMSDVSIWKKEWRYYQRQVFENTRKIYKDAQVTVIRPGILRWPYVNYVSLFFNHQKEIDRQIYEFKPDVIVGFGIMNSYLSSKAVLNKDIPFIYYWIDLLHRLIPTKMFQPLGVWFEKRALRYSDAVLTINEALRRVVINLGAPEAKTCILRTGIDSNRFVPGPADSELKQSLGLGDDSIVLFFMGWLYRFSGLKEIALELNRPEYSDVKLVIVGEGDLYDDLVNIRQEFGLKDRLILTGKKPYAEIPALISAADICILPSYTDEKIMQDIVPIKLYEYMAMQKPVISTRLPGVVLEFGEDNGMVYVDSPADVLKKAVELVKENRIDDLGLKAREFVAENNWEKITDEFETILQEAIEKKKESKWSG